RFGEIELARGDSVDAEGLQQFAHFAQLARVVGGDDDPARELPVRGNVAAHITASFCRSTSLPMPLRASPSRVASCSSLNRVFSAVACTSISRPSPVMTKLASVSASESSA